MTNSFENLKNNSNKNRYVPILFQIIIQDNKSYLNILDENTKKSVDTNYRFYEGSEREVLKIYERILEKEIYKFDWFENKNGIFLGDQNNLIDNLKNCSNLVNENFEKISFSNETKEIYLSIKESEGQIKTKFLFNESKNNEFSFISSKYVIIENNIFTLKNSFENFERANYFETKLPKKKLEEFLAILFGNFTNLNVIYKNYSFVLGEDLKTRPTLIFEKIDELNNLYIRISESINNLEPDFIESFNPDKAVNINDLENKISIHNLKRIDLSSTITHFNKVINSYKKEVADKNNYYYEENLFILEEKLAVYLVHKELSNILSQFIVYGAEKLKEYNISTIDPKLRLSLTHNLGFFEGDIELDFGSDKFSLLDVINLYKKNSYIKLSDGTNAILNKSYIEKLSRILKKSKDKVKFSFFDLPIIDEFLDQEEYKEYFKKYRDIFLGFNNIHDIKLDTPNIKYELRHYQEKGYKWLRYLYQNNLGGCLADDMGLGKTLQTISLLSSIYPQEKKSSLIIMPKSLLYNWENEILKFNPNLSYYIYYSNKKDLNEAKKYNLIFTTYSMIRNDIEKFKNEEFNYIILDESQNIKNMQSQISKAVVQLKSKHRLALSGTPIENNLSELYSLFRFLNPNMFPSFESFFDDYMNPIQKDNDIDVINELKKKIYPFILRRLKKDVLTELPDKIEQTMFVDMTEEQTNLYEQRRAFYYKNLKKQISEEGLNKSQFLILQALNELRQIASIPEVKTEGNIISSKREILIDSLKDIISLGHRALVFTNYLGSIDYISEDLEKEGINHLIMTGATSNRQELVDKFQNSDKYKVFLMTLKTGGVGLNLTKADYVFIYDPWWNKSVENQAIDRTHRIGQDKTVFSYKLITKNTIEEKILKLQELKTDLFNQIISSDDTSIKSLTESDIDFILGE
jgi:SNF2 family DNA or RNA helicase